MPTKAKSPTSGHGHCSTCHQTAQTLCDLAATLKRLEKKMAQVPKAVENLRASMVKLKDSMANIKADVEKLEANQLPPEVIQEIQGHADELAADAQAIQDMVPDAPNPDNPPANP